MSRYKHRGGGGPKHAQRQRDHQRRRDGVRTDGITQDRQPMEHTAWAAWCRVDGWSGDRRPDWNSARADLMEHRITHHPDRPHDRGL